MSSRNSEPLPCTETMQTFVLVTAGHFNSMGTQAEEELVFLPKAKGTSTGSAARYKLPPLTVFSIIFSARTSVD